MAWRPLRSTEAAASSENYPTHGDFRHRRLTAASCFSFSGFALPCPSSRTGCVRRERGDREFFFFSTLRAWRRDDWIYRALRSTRTFVVLDHGARLVYPSRRGDAVPRRGNDVQRRKTTHLVEDFFFSFLRSLRFLHEHLLTAWGRGVSRRALDPMASATRGAVLALEGLNEHVDLQKPNRERPCSGGRGPASRSSAEGHDWTRRGWSCVAKLARARARPGPRAPVYLRGGDVRGPTRPERARVRGRMCVSDRAPAPSAERAEPACRQWRLELGARSAAAPRPRNRGRRTPLAKPVALLDIALSPKLCRRNTASSGGRGNRRAARSPSGEGACRSATGTRARVLCTESLWF